MAATATLTKNQTRPADAKAKGELFSTDFLDRYTGTVLVEARRCNPNGDPDAGNTPRIDLISGHGLMTPMSIKRKIRNFLESHYGLELYHRTGAILRNQRAGAIERKKLPAFKEDDKPTMEQLRTNQRAICEQFFDARAFGAVLDLKQSRGLNAAGPIWIGMAETVDPVQVDELSITRQSVETEDEKKENRTMGTLSVINYGLYRFEFEIMPILAARSGFTLADFEMFKLALTQAFEQDQASNRKIDLREIVVFRHASTNGAPCLGHASRASLRDRVRVTKKAGIEVPNKYDDYDVVVDEAGLHEHLHLERWV